MNISSGPISDLYHEHNAILVILEILDAVGEKIRRGDKVSKEDLENMVEFISTFADRCHHGKEEAILLPALSANKYANRALVDAIIGEHKTGRDLVGGMRKAAESYSAGNAESYHFAANARAYADMLLLHIRRENVQLFPDSDKVLGEEVQKQMMQRFELVEKNVIGEGKHELFEAQLETWKKAYL